MGKQIIIAPNFRNDRVSFSKTLFYLLVPANIEHQYPLFQSGNKNQECRKNELLRRYALAKIQERFPVFGTASKKELVRDVEKTSGSEMAPMSSREMGEAVGHS